MGWSFTHGATRKSIIAEIVGQHRKIHAKAFVGNTMWTVEEDKEGTKFVACFLLQRSAVGWGYKAMDESMGPVQVSCPLSFLDLADDAAGFSYGYAVGWREKVRAYHAQRARVRTGLKPGAILVLREGCRPARLQVVEARPLRAMAVGGAVYRVPARMIADVLPPSQHFEAEEVARRVEAARG